MKFFLNIVVLLSAAVLAGRADAGTSVYDIDFTFLCVECEEDGVFTTHPSDGTTFDMTGQITVNDATTFDGGAGVVTAPDVLDWTLNFSSISGALTGSISSLADSFVMTGGGRFLQIGNELWFDGPLGAEFIFTDGGGLFDPRFEAVIGTGSTPSGNSVFASSFFSDPGGFFQGDASVDGTQLLIGTFVAPVPLPAAGFLLLGALGGLGLMRRRKA